MEDDENRLYWLNQTGHFNLDVSDFGWWHCFACDKRGDDYTSPEDYGCVQTDPYGIEYQI